MPKKGLKSTGSIRATNVQFSILTGFTSVGKYLPFIALVNAKPFLIRKKL